MEMNISNEGLELIKKFESFKASPYLCPAGIPTIGYGTTHYRTRAVALDEPSISEETASILLEHQVNDIYAKAVNHYTKVPTTQNQFDALVSFAYNLGVGALQRSTLLKHHNKSDYKKASKEFGKWTHANGKVLKGLVKRRKTEKKLYLA